MLIRKLFQNGLFLLFFFLKSLVARKRSVSRKNDEGLEVLIFSQIHKKRISMSPSFSNFAKFFVNNKYTD